MYVFLYIVSSKTNKRDYQEWSYGELNNVKKFYFQKTALFKLFPSYFK